MPKIHKTAIETNIFSHKKRYSVCEDLLNLRQRKAFSSRQQKSIQLFLQIL